MPLAFHLLAHKDPAQVERLARAVLRPEHLLVLHFDRRAPAALHALGRRLASEHPNVLVQRPRAVLWGSDQITRLQAEAIGLALAQGRAWTHFINLSGQCYPLRPVEEIDAFLAARPDVSFLTWFVLKGDTRWANAADRIRFTYYWWPWVHRIMTLPGAGRRLRALLGWGEHTVPVRRRPERAFPRDFECHGGSNWVMLSHAACEHLTADPDCQRLLLWMRHACISDELFFATALRGGKWTGPCENRNFREQDFAVGTISPRTFTRNDLPRLRASDAFFARKFDSQIDSAVLDELEQRANPAL